MAAGSEVAVAGGRGEGGVGVSQHALGAVGQKLRGLGEGSMLEGETPALSGAPAA